MYLGMSVKCSGQTVCACAGVEGTHFILMHAMGL